MKTLQLTDDEHLLAIKGLHKLIKSKKDSLKSATKHDRENITEKREKEIIEIQQFINKITL